MFGLDLEKFIEDNVWFKNQGGRTNQDIYYNIKNDKFWIHSYFGNESLSPGTEKENILIYSIKNYDDFEFSCSMCYDGGSNNEHGYKCNEWQECQAEMLYENIQDHKYDDFDIVYQIEELLDNVHISELAELWQLLEYNYGNYYDWVQERFNPTIYINLKDELIDGILDYGFPEKLDDNCLDGPCQALVMHYDSPYENEEINPKLQKIVNLLDECKIIEALELLK